MCAPTLPLRQLAPEDRSNKVAPWLLASHTGGSLNHKINGWGIPPDSA
jgi:hypothetical protein